MNDMLFKTVNPGATEKEIITLEKRFRLKLPQDLKEFYKKHNGAIFRSDAQINAESLSLRYFYPIGHQYQDHILTIDKLLEWQEMDMEFDEESFIPMYFVPFCADAADDCYYIRVDEAGYGKVYYIFSEFLDEFLSNPEAEGLVAESFTEFLKMIHFSK